MEYREGSIVFENWEITRLLGEGANGKVYEIQKTDFGIITKSALKVISIPRSESDIKTALNEGMDEESVTTYFQGFVKEIIKEVAVMAELKSHPNIVAHEDHCIISHEKTIGWDILIRMELLTPMNDYLLSHKMTEAEVIRLGKEICSALEFCQKKAVIHRDIKPENIFCTESGVFKLGDFGIARTIEKTTSGLSKKGTESYMAPEVYLRKPYGSSVDIYSLGLVLYKLLNHNRLPLFPLAPQPIRFEDREDALSRRMDGETFVAPAAAGDELGKIILKACAYDPKERYHTAAEMRAALDALAVRDSSQQIYESQKDEYDEETQGMWDTSINPDDEKTEGTMYQWELDNEVTSGIDDEKTVSDVRVEKKTKCDNEQKSEKEFLDIETTKQENIFYGLQEGSRYGEEWKDETPQEFGCLYEQKPEKKTMNSEYFNKKKGIGIEKILLIGVIAVLLIGVWRACGNNSDNKSGVQKSETSVSKLDDILESGTVQVNDKEIQLPCDYSELLEVAKAMGTGEELYSFLIQEKNVFMEAKEGCSYRIWDAERGIVFMDIQNQSTEKKKLEDCLVVGIHVGTSKDNVKEYPIVFPGGIKVGSSLEDVIQAFGEATRVWNYDTYDSYDWYVDNNSRRTCPLSIYVQTVGPDAGKVVSMHYSVGEKK